MQVHFYQKPQKLQVENKSESDLDSTRHFFFELRKKHFFPQPVKSSWRYCGWWRFALKSQMKCCVYAVCFWVYKYALCVYLLNFKMDSSCENPACDTIFSFLKLKTGKYSTENCNNLCTDKQVFKYNKHSN